MKMDDWVGRTVRTLVQLQTGDGLTFPAGRIMKVERHWRGRLTLVDDQWCGKCGLGYRACITHVPRNQVELVAELT